MLLYYLIASLFCYFIILLIKYILIFDFIFLDERIAPSILFHPNDIRQHSSFSYGRCNFLQYVSTFKNSSSLSFSTHKVLPTFLMLPLMLTHDFALQRSPSTRSTSYIPSKNYYTLHFILTRQSYSKYIFFKFNRVFRNLSQIYSHISDVNHGTSAKPGTTVEYHG